MSSNREKLKPRSGAAFENDHKEVKPFGTFNPMQQERIITHMNTIGSKKDEMRRADAHLDTSDIDIMNNI
ncbi:MAG: hypothetical protein IKL57_09165 [Oscillospiraceae bacterium]|nr:hypothetical protein [Oscillospiraceae bacterium]MBR3952169.1 hypothetical protein [Oscillospiraceae bacterium]